MCPNLNHVKRLTLFAMHSVKPNIPESEVTYINFLLEISDLVVVLTTNTLHDQDDYLFSDKVFIIKCQNIGLDFGLWYQFFEKHSSSLKNINEIKLINDSFYCLKTLKTIKNGPGT
jgi:hypothetical protein